ncbi:hypothetical protein SCFA_1500002 [anaerobic digester metagenome]|uniref:Uncharacterized protein n=1 Tax=anaerobic digester metagenome TaxID=1263854 RepID=A0A485LV08_9ZZZZ
MNPRPLAPKASALAKLRHIPQNLMQMLLYLNKVCASSSANTNNNEKKVQLALDGER